MNAADIAIVAIIVLSAIVSLFRGFFREAIAVAGWAAAVWCALVYTEQVAAHLAAYIETPSVRQAAAFLLIFICVLLISGIVSKLVHLLVKGTGLGGTDRVLGAVFGVARGALIVGLLVLFAGMTAIPSDPWWRESRLIPHVEAYVEEARVFLPGELRDTLSGGFGGLLPGTAEIAPAATAAGQIAPAGEPTPGAGQQPAPANQAAPSSATTGGSD